MKIINMIKDYVKCDKIDKVLSRIISSQLILHLLFIIFGGQSVQYLILPDNLNMFKLIVFFLLIYLLNFLFCVIFNKKRHIESIILLISFSICIVFWTMNYVNFYFIIALIILYFLVICYCLSKNNVDIRKILSISDRHLYILVGVLFVVSAIVSFVLCYFFYNNFIYENFDLGVFTNIFYHLRVAGKMINSNNEMNMVLSHYLIHISPIIYLALPLYFIFPHVLSIEITQIFIVFSGVFPLIKICKKYHIGNELVLVISIIFLFYPALYCGFHTGFHENCFLVPLLLWFFYFSICKQYYKMYIFLILLLLIKEDVFIYIIIYSLFIMLNEKAYKHGIIMILIASIYFVAAYTFLSHYSSGVMIGRFYNLILDQNNLLKSIEALFINPGYIISQLLNTVDDEVYKVEFLLQLLLPLSLLPIIIKKFNRLILLLPMVINIITKYVFLYDIDYQYTFATSAFLIYCFLLSIKDINNKRSFKLVLALSISSVFVMYNAYMINPLKMQYEDYLSNKDTYKGIDAILKTIPKEATINSSSNFITHVAYRDVVYDAYFHNNALDVDYVLVDLKRETVIDANYYLTNGYEIYYTDNEYIKILKKK